MKEGTVFIIAALIVLALAVWIHSRRQKRQREIRRQAEDRLREEALDRVLTGRADGGRGAGPSVPFDVKYDVDQRKRGKQISRMAAASPLMLHLTEHSELSTREYMFHVADHITLGQASGNNIVIKGPGIADNQCEIFCIQKALYVKNTGTGGLVFLTRKDHRIMIDNQSVTLENKDTLQVGDYIYEIELL